MASHAQNWKVRRAKAVIAKAAVYGDGKRALTICEVCGMDVYLLEGQIVCSECRTTNRRKLIRMRKRR